MKIWTVQPSNILMELKEGKTVYPDSEKIIKHNDESFIEAYKWMSTKMREKKINSDNSDFPFWGWYRYNWENEYNEIPSCVDQGYHLILLDIPDNEVVLSDYSQWHCVLNRIYCSNALTSEDYEHDHEMFDSLPNIAKLDAMKKSWDHVFDISPIENDFVSQGKYVQATFWYIKPEYLINTF